MLVQKKVVPLQPSEPATLPIEQRTWAGRFLLTAMRYNKQPFSIEEQINILKSRGQLFISEDEAKAVFENISYFRLVGYWRTMEQNCTSHTFRAESKFDITLYQFDSEL